MSCKSSRAAFGPGDENVSKWPSGHFLEFAFVVEHVLKSHAGKVLKPLSDLGLKTIQ